MLPSGAKNSDLNRQLNPTSSPFRSQTRIPQGLGKTHNPAQLSPTLGRANLQTCTHTHAQAHKPSHSVNPNTHTHSQTHTNKHTHKQTHTTGKGVVMQHLTPANTPHESRPPPRETRGEREKKKQSSLSRNLAFHESSETPLLLGYKMQKNKTKTRPEAGKVQHETSGLRKPMNFVRDGRLLEERTRPSSRNNGRASKQRR